VNQKDLLLIQITVSALEEWMELINIREANATFSPDGKYLFFSGGDVIYRSSEEIIAGLRSE